MNSTAKRNDPCPCGSGKKFKQCCLQRTAPILTPQAVDQILQAALLYYQAGQLNRAEALYRQLLLSYPNHPDALNMLGVLAHQFSQYHNAVKLIQQAIDVHGSNASFYNNLGLTYNALRKFEEAVGCFQQAIDIKPDHAGTYLNLGNTLVNQGQLDGAIACFQRALAANPTLTEAYLNLGNAFRKQDKLDETVGCLNRALAANPSLAEAHYNLGKALQHQGYLDEAITCYQRAIAMRADYPEAHTNLGHALIMQGKVGEAIVYCQQAIDGTMLYAMHYIAAYTPSEILTAHLRVAERFELPQKLLWPIHDNDRTPDRRLKIGYVSPDFRLHSVAYFIEPLIAHHDKSQVEVFCYYNYSKRDAVTERLNAYVNHWIACIAWSDDELARRIRDDRIDILVDLAGHTLGNRLLAFARKPAPIQVSYLGYPDTTGLSAMDYRFSNLDADPLSHDAYNTETLFRLPQALWCFRPPSAAGPKVFATTPAETEGYVTFASLNNIAKVSDEALALWADLLHAVPTARLLMSGIPAGSARETLLNRFAHHGIGPERLTLHGKLPTPEFQALFRQIDIALDPFPYHGTTTSCETLWMGIPVISLCGQTFVSRSGLVLLKALKLDELIAHSTSDYLRIASDLAWNLPRLSELRSSLRQRFLDSPLRDEARFARDIEQAYRSMWHTWCLTNHRS